MYPFLCQYLITFRHWRILMNYFCSAFLSRLIFFEKPYFISHLLVIHNLIHSIICTDMSVCYALTNWYIFLGFDVASRFFENNLQCQYRWSLGFLDVVTYLDHFSKNYYSSNFKVTSEMGIEKQTILKVSLHIREWQSVCLRM